MVLIKNGLMALAMVLSFVTLPVSANSEEDLKTFVDENTQRLVSKLNAEKGLYEKDREAFYQSMEAELENFVDFRRIAARVMGRYARQASPEQRNQFVEKFKRSLFDRYAQVVVDAEGFEMEVKRAKINAQNSARATVDMEVVSESGDRFRVTYSMYKTNEGRWLMENIIAEGVNVGLGFRDTFSQEVEKQQGDIQAVIDDWSDAIETLDLEAETDNS